MSWTEVRLADVMTQVSEREHLDRNKTYVTCGVRGKARGLFTRESQLGREIKAQYLYRLRAGEFVYNRLFAGEGAFAIVPPEAHGLYVSNEFPTFHVDDSVILPELLALWFSRPQVWSMVADASTGSTQSRSRWKEAQLLATQVVVPPIDQQRRIVDLLSSADRLMATFESEAAAAVVARDSLLDLAITTSQNTAPLASLVAEPPKGFTAATAPKMFRYAALSDVKRDRLLVPSELPEHDFESAPSRARLVVQPGDSVVPTVGIHNRRSLFVGPQHAGLVVSTGFCVLRPKADADPRLVWAIVRSTPFVEWGKQHTRGTTLPAVGNKELLRFSAPTSLPPTILDAIAAADEAVGRSADKASKAAQLRNQLLHDLLSGTHAVPESYDRFVAGVPT